MNITINGLIFIKIIGQEERIWKPRVGYDWNNAADRKRFMLDLAHDANFDPADPACWYRVTQKDITEKVFFFF